MCVHVDIQCTWLTLSKKHLSAGPLYAMNIELRIVLISELQYHGYETMTILQQSRFDTKSKVIYRDLCVSYICVFVCMCVSVSLYVCFSMSEFYV